MPRHTSRSTRPCLGTLRRVVLLTGLLCAGWAQAFDLQGHRGARGLAPENTLAGFELALAIGVDTLELDVALTADDVPVLSHDTALNPDITRDFEGHWLKDRSHLLRKLNAQALRDWDVGRINPVTRYARELPEQKPVDGEHIPTLASLFERVQAIGADQVRFNIETKINPLSPAESAPPETLVRSVLAVVQAYGMEKRVDIQSFDWRTLRICRQLAPDIPRIYLTAQQPRFDTLKGGEWNDGLRLQEVKDTPALVAAAGGRIWSPHHGDLTQHLLRRARTLGLKVIPWTVNEAADMERLIDWGVDGLITDRPDRLREILQQRDMPLPPRVGADSTKDIHGANSRNTYLLSNASSADMHTSVHRKSGPT